MDSRRARVRWLAGATILIALGAAIAARGVFVEQWWVWQSHSDDPAVRLEAAQRLIEVGSTRAAEVGVRVWRSDPATTYPWAEDSLARSLVRLGEPALAEIFRSFSRDPDDGVTTQHLSSYLLGEFGRPAIRECIAHLAHPVAEVRLLAARSLIGFGPLAAEAAPTLEERLGDPDPNVRELAVEALGSCGPAAARAVPRLMRIAIDDESFDASMAVERIRCVSVASLDLLVEALGARYVEAPAHDATESLGAAGRAGAPSLLAMLEADEVDLDRTLRTLGHVGAPSDDVREALIMCARSSCYYDPSVLVTAIDRIGDSAVIAAIDNAPDSLGCDFIRGMMGGHASRWAPTLARRLREPGACPERTILMTALASVEPNAELLDEQYVRWILQGARAMGVSWQLPVLRSLGRLAEVRADALDQLLAAVRDGGRNLRIGALLAINLGVSELDDGARSVVHSALRHADEESRSLAALALFLGGHGDGDTLGDCERILADTIGDPHSTGWPLVVVGAHHDLPERLVATVGELVRTTSDEHHRNLLLDALISAGGNASLAVPELTRRLLDTSLSAPYESRIRYEALDSLRRYDALNAHHVIRLVKHLVALDGYTNPWWRFDDDMLRYPDDYNDACIHTALLLGDIARESDLALAELTKLLSNENADVRYVAVLALAATGGERSVAPLVRALRDRLYGIRRFAAAMLGRAGKDATGAVPALTAALEDPSPDVRLAADAALRAIGSG